MQRGLPWLLTLVFAATTAWALSRSPEPLAPAPPAAAPECPPPTDSRTALPLKQLAGLRACLGEVRTLEQRLAVARGDSPLPRADEPEVEACLDQPAVRSAIAGELARREQLREDEQLDRRQARLTAFDDWAEGSLQLSNDERHGLQDYVCSLRELKERALSQVDEEQDSAALLEELRKQRKEILGDVKTALGEERYAKLREIGGVGLLMDATRC